MSGGQFDYKDYIIGEIADFIEDRVLKGGTPRPFDTLDSWDIREWEREHESERKYIRCTKEAYEKDPFMYSKVGENEQTILKYKAAHVIMTLASIFAHRIDWYESCDDGEDSFNKRLEKDLSEAKTYVSSEELEEMLDMIIEKIKK